VAAPRSEGDFGSTDLDVDDIVKPVSDALCAIAFGDDKLVSEWLSRKTDLERTEIRDPPPSVAAVLEDWLAAKQPFVYVCVMGEGANHAELPRDCTRSARSGRREARQ
jgi:hypothetical protein